MKDTKVFKSKLQLNIINILNLISVVSLQLTANSTNGHSIYMKEHFIRLMDPNKPKGRTLFLLNVPPYVTEESLEKFFSRIAAVQSVAFAEKPGKEEAEKWRQTTIQTYSNIKSPFKFKVAYVVFNKSSGLAKALQVNSIDLYSETANPDESFISSGIHLWHSEYDKKFISNLDEELEKIDQFIEEYDEREREAQMAARNSEADADGWVTVGKQGRNAGFEQTEGVINKLEDKMAKSKKKKELSNFYTFQIRESKMKNIAELREKFEEDKRKIEVLKQTRRFKPF